MSSQGGGRKGWVGKRVGGRTQGDKGSPGMGGEGLGYPDKSRGLWTARETDATALWGLCDSGCGRVSYCTEKEEQPLWVAQRSVVATHGQVHKGEDIEFRHDGEAQEHAIQEEAPAAQLLVQLPPVQVDTEHRDKDRGQEQAH